MVGFNVPVSGLVLRDDGYVSGGLTTPQCVQSPVSSRVPMSRHSWTFCLTDVFVSQQSLVKSYTSEIFRFFLFR